MNFPSVMVPVLSMTAALILAITSITVPPLKRMPSLEALPMPAKKARGTEMTRAQGQEITRKVRAV